MEYGEQEDEEIEVEEEESETEEEKDEEKGNCMKVDDTPWNQMHYKCKQAVENSSRFSLRVLEAMRFLQSHENVLPISSVKDIVDYITKNYNNDGDLYAQVRTALIQLCTDGFVVEVLKDEYQLIGTFRSSTMLEMCNCDVDRSDSEIYFSTPKHTKLRKKFNKKIEKKSRCHCEKLQDEPKSGTKRKRSMIFSDKNITSSRMHSLNNTMLTLPKDRALRSIVRDSNIKMHSTTDNIAQREKSAYDTRDNHDNNSREHTPKRIRKTNNVAEGSRSMQQYEKINVSPTDQTNENSCDGVFQEIKNLFPNRSQTREKELKNWIRRCRRECERQKRKEN